MENLSKAVLLASSIIWLGCSTSKQEQTPTMPSIQSETFGALPNGAEVTQYTLTNANGLEVKVINYGGIITSLKTPDKHGNLEDIVLGYDNLQGYLDATPYFGAIVGRYGNRIAKGKFTLNGEEYTLAINNDANHLHGGIQAFDKVLWGAAPFENADSVGIVFTYLSPDGEEGYPGNLTTTVTYTLGNDNSLTFDYVATTDKPTVVNLTQHSYFNLTGMKEDILGHKLLLAGSRYVPVDSTLIPTGVLELVAGTPFDFSEWKPMGAEINSDHAQIKFGGGYDHCWVLDNDEGLALAASVVEPQSGRVLDVYTTEPGIQFYAGNFLDGSIVGKNGKTYHKRTGFCLETQHFPDSPNQPEFPTTTLNPGETYKTTTKFVFSVK